jgi:glycosyltransferase involved in cell wall biosynthesis
VKLLVLVDRLHWAYHSIAKGLRPYIDFDILPVKGGRDRIKQVYKKYDRFLVMGFQNYDNVVFLPREHTLVGVHSHHSWDDRKTTPEKDVVPPKQILDFLQSFAGVNVVSRRLHALFPFATYTPNGVDTTIFQPLKPLRTGRDMVVGCTGSPKHDWRKGLSQFIVPAAEKVGLKIHPAWKDVALERMPDYYNSVDVYVCASSSEGMSLGILEALACGRPVVNTFPTEVPTLMFRRNVDDIADALQMLIDNKIDKPVSRRFAENWSWKVRHKAWKEFLTS